MSFLSQLNWRSAVKMFTDEKISPENLSQIKTSIQMAPTSFGLQPFFVKIVSDTKTKMDLQDASFGQPQVGSASHILVFCARTDTRTLLNHYIEESTAGDEAKKEKMQGFVQVVEKFFKEKSESKIFEWASNQVHLVHGFALAACAELNIDSCSIGGFNPQKVDELLALPSHIKSTVLLPIGYRAENSTYPKFRFTQSYLFEEEK